jgi:hypothetical protein
MRTPSIRTLAAIAYERGEEFDPADPAMLSPTLARHLSEAAATTTAGVTVFGLSPADGGRFQEAGPEPCPFDAPAGEAPSWLEAGDLVPIPLHERRGELLSELAVVV